MKLDRRTEAPRTDTPQNAFHLIIVTRLVAQSIAPGIYSLDKVDALGAVLARDPEADPSHFVRQEHLEIGKSQINCPLALYSFSFSPAWITP